MSGDHNIHCSGNQPDIVEKLRINAEEAKIRNLELMHADLTAAIDEIERLRKERDELLGPNPVEQMLREELAALRKQIDELQPVAWHFSGKPLYLLEGIKK